MLTTPQNHDNGNSSKPFKPWYLNPNGKNRGITKQKKTINTKGLVSFVPIRPLTQRAVVHSPVVHQPVLKNTASANRFTGSSAPSQLPRKKEVIGYVFHIYRPEDMQSDNKEKVKSTPNQMVLHNETEKTIQKYNKVVKQERLSISIKDIIN